MTVPPEPGRIFKCSICAVALAAAAVGCDKSSRESKDAVPVGIPVDAGIVKAVVDPAGAGPHSGPTATVFGTVTISGDPAPTLNDVIAQIPEECQSSKQYWGKLFREGKGRALADVLVAVTGYKGYVPAPGVAVPVSAERCKFDTRTIAVTFGQRIDVTSKDDRTYIPNLIGANQQAMLVAIPKGEAVGVYPLRPGHYELADAGFPFMRADVFTLKYATHDVTDLKGHYTVGRIPPGTVTVSAFLPVTGATQQKKVTLAPNSSKRLDFTLAFDAAAYARSVGQAAAGRSGGNTK